MNIETLKERIFSKELPKHIGIILDGNGRWATKRMLPRNMGHKKGVETLKEIVLETKKIGIPYLTVFAFSTVTSAALFAVFFIAVLRAASAAAISSA